ncbi:MAG: ribonuclease P protein component [Candidatus Dormibacteraeota bacterium]|nr:ribonuclease P protein component [Candidatus Dormibacteraeota bacterium]
MLARLRLRRGIDFRQVYATRRVSHGKLIVLHWSDNQLGHPRVGFSISTRVGGSVQRSLLKRRLRELTRPLLATSNAGVDLVVVARPVAAAATFAELESEFKVLAARVLGL